ncbi:MAG TPA: hypothetical protein ENN17_02760 [bacterium]|nr:hypothetical protein [bacterium]
MYSKRICFLASLFIAAVCLPVSAEGLDRLFPEPGLVPGWNAQGPPEHYAAETLYEIINGEAELYHAYGFREMAAITYIPEEGDGYTDITVYLYDMDTPENAFGVYSSYRYPDYDFDRIGTEAMVSDYGVKFYQGPYFVDLSFSDASEPIRLAGAEISRAIAEAISAPPDPPAILNLLPAENQVDKTARYAAKEMLNQSFLPSGLEARYRVGDREVTGFVILFDEPDQAAEALGKLGEFYLSSHASTVEADLPGEKGLAVETAYQGILIAAVKGRYLGGVRELNSAEEGIPLLKQILARF